MLIQPSSKQYLAKEPSPPIPILPFPIFIAEHDVIL